MGSLVRPDCTHTIVNKGYIQEDYNYIYDL